MLDTDDAIKLDAPERSRPETVANLCFGGMFRNRLYICGSTSLYAVYTSATGAMKP